MTSRPAQRAPQFSRGHAAPKYRAAWIERLGARERAHATGSKPASSTGCIAVFNAVASSAASAIAMRGAARCASLCSWAAPAALKARAMRAPGSGSRSANITSCPALTHKPPTVLLHGLVSASVNRLVVTELVITGPWALPFTAAVDVSCISSAVSQRPYSSGVTRTMFFIRLQFFSHGHSDPHASVVARPSTGQPSPARPVVRPARAPNGSGDTHKPVLFRTPER